MVSSSSSSSSSFSGFSSSSEIEEVFVEGRDGDRCYSDKWLTNQMTVALSTTWDLSFQKNYNCNQVDYDVMVHIV